MFASLQTVVLIATCLCTMTTGEVYTQPQQIHLSYGGKSETFLSRGQTYEVRFVSTATVDSNFALCAATWRPRRNIPVHVVFDSGPLAPLCENDVIHKTGSTGT